MDNLISKIRTTEERDKILSEVELLLINLYEHQGAGIVSALQNQVRLWVANEVRGFLPENLQEAETALKALKEKLLGLKVLKLKIAFEPTDSSIEKFVTFIRKRAKITDEVDKGSAGNIILDIDLDPNIFGGAEITYEGEYRDFSLKRLFHEEYKKEEEELMKILSKHQSTK